LAMAGVDTARSVKAKRNRQVIGGISPRGATPPSGPASHKMTLWLLC
jgi:hypothetical protein